MDVLVILRVIFPLLSFIFFCVGLNNNGRYLKGKSEFIGIFVLIFMAFFMSFSDYSEGDRFRYVEHFLKNYSIQRISDFHDPAWAIYNVIVALITDIPEIFFLITALFYCLGYYMFALKTFSRKYIYFFLIISVGMFGFCSYGTNCIRNGIALTLCLIGFSRNDLKKYLFFFLAILFHKSVVLVVLTYIITQKVKDIKIYISIWIICLVLSASGVSLLNYADFLSSSDDRLDKYTAWERDNYKTGFRVDFIIYSFIPALFSFFCIKKMKISDEIYLRFFNMYLFLNSLWLLIIRIAFTNRFAYLSWFLIPILFYYPFCNIEEGRKIISKRYLIYIVLSFMLLNIYLTLKK